MVNCALKQTHSTAIRVGLTEYRWDALKTHTFNKTIDKIGGGKDCLDKMK